MCTAYATMVNRGDAVHSDKWRKLLLEWKIPILDLTHLRQIQTMITTTDYFCLHNISIDLESTDGHWDVDTYHMRDTRENKWPSLHAIENSWYDPDNTICVNYIPQDMHLRGGWTLEGGVVSLGQVGSWTGLTPDSEIYHALVEALPVGRPLIDWDTARRIIEDGDHITLASSAEEIGDVL